ncbi:MAG: SAM-dependent chlorinase/fluorinase [Saprospiraceae bacterium]|nr:SAM-dependent chlorinase/fluorinase [Saprospiraceae bacterium]
MHIVSITTDFGLQDYYVAELKAHILQRSTDIQLIDVSHSVDSHDIVQAAHFLDNVFRAFPPKSIHLVAVYNYYDKYSRFILIEREGHFFIGPDNGVFSLIFDDLRTEEAVVLDHSEISNKSLAEVFAWTVGCIVEGKSLDQIGSSMDHITQKMGIKPVVTRSQIRATIIHVDHYENVIINLKKDQFEKIRNGRAFQLYYKQTDPVTKVSEDYADVPITDVMCLFNSAGYMEIGINMGKASSMLNLNKNETIQINFLD